MSKQEELLANVLSNLENISLILVGKEEVAQFLAKKSTLTGSEVFKNVVELVEKLYDSVNKCRTDFIDGCDKLCQTTEADNNSVISMTTKNVDVIDQDGNDDTNTEGTSKNNENATDGIESGQKATEQTVEKVGLKVIDITKLRGSGANNNFDTTLDTTLSPKQKKSVKFDSSVVILESSEEESQKKSDKNEKKKAASKQSQAKDSLSDSEEDKSKKKRRKRKDDDLIMLSGSSDSCEMQKLEVKKRPRRKSRKTSSASEMSDYSDFEEKLETRKLKSRRAENKERNQKKFSQLKAAITKRKESANKKSSQKQNKQSDSDDSDVDSESPSISFQKPKSPERKVPILKLKIPLPRIDCEKLGEIYNKEVIKSHEPDSNSSCSQSDSSTEHKKKKKRHKGKTDSSDEKKTKKRKRTKTKEHKKNTEESSNPSSSNESDNTPLSKKTKSEERCKLDNNSTRLNGSEKEKEFDETGSKAENNSIENKDEGDNAQSDKSVSEHLHNENDKIVKENKSGAKDKNEKNGVEIENSNVVTSDVENEKTSDKDKSSDEKNGNEASDSDEKKDPKKKELLIKINRKIRKPAVISDSDSKDSDTEEKSKNDKDDSEEEDRDNKSKKSKKKQKQVISDSESEFEVTKADQESDSDSEKSEDDEETSKPQKTRSRIKRTKDSSSDEDDKSTRKQIRKVIDKDRLSETTKKAEADEKERKARILEKQRKYNQIYDLKSDAKIEKVVLEYNEENNTEVLGVCSDLVKKLKPHQASGIQFMWDACFESLKRAKKTSGSGCILAHCMGLGKTLQVIALVHTLITNSEKTKVSKVMVVCPVNTVINWKQEFKKWVKDEDDIDVYELVTCKQNYERQYAIKEWHQNGGVLIIGYAMFRNLSNPDNKKIPKKMRASFLEGLVDPGPDLVVCDEGHLLKNEKTNLSIAMNRIKTLRRIVLTGTPLQNNLKEYWCMVQFIKPNLLGTYKEYLNRFVNPITNGQYTDSTPHDIQIMRKRSHVLHKLLDGVVQRRDYAVLAPYLPPKYEYVLFVPLTEIQVKLYQHYMDKFSRRGDGSNRTSFLFADFQELQRICTHPRVLLDKSIENFKKGKDFDSDEDDEGSLKDFIDDGSGSDGSSSNSSSSDSDDSTASIKSKEKKNGRGRMTRAQAAERRQNGEPIEVDCEESVKPKEWWQEYCDGDELDNINHSSKMLLLFEMLKECDQIGDKVLIFSQSLYTLNCIEYFLQLISDATHNGNDICGFTGTWDIGLDYFRLDGSSSCDNRATWCDSFNCPKNIRARLFLISTKAGGLGINLVAANRVIIFDVSWNPSHDIQSIYRVYRFGQTKPCYIYRFVSYGTMEMKIYERQVTKQAISKRVIDEQQIDRHYSQNDIQELYKVDLTPEERPIPLVPKDVLLGEMLQKYEKHLFKYHEHQSLLENKQDEELNEEERKAAWDEFENEKVMRNYNTSISNFAGMGPLAGMGMQNSAINFSPQAISMALTNIVRRDNPTWSEIQVKGVIPALVMQMRVQLSEGDLTMFNRVQNEIKMYQAEMQRYYQQQQQMFRILQQQQQQQLQQQPSVNGSLLRSQLDSGTSRQLRARPQPPDVIELND